MQTKSTERDVVHASLLTMGKPLDLAEAGKKLNAIEKELAELEEKWLGTTEELETLAG